MAKSQYQLPWKFGEAAVCPDCRVLCTVQNTRTSDDGVKGGLRFKTQYRKCPLCGYKTQTTCVVPNGSDPRRN